MICISWFFGDSDSDIIAEKSLDCKTIKIEPNFKLEDAGQKVEESLRK